LCDKPTICSRSVVVFTLHASYHQYPKCLVLKTAFRDVSPGTRCVSSSSVLHERNILTQSGKQLTEKMRQGETPPMFLLKSPAELHSSGERAAVLQRLKEDLSMVRDNLVDESAVVRGSVSSGELGKRRAASRKLEATTPEAEQLEPSERNSVVPSVNTRSSSSSSSSSSHSSRATARGSIASGAQGRKRSKSHVA